MSVHKFIARSKVPGVNPISLGFDGWNCGRSILERRIYPKIRRHLISRCVEGKLRLSHQKVGPSHIIKVSSDNAIFSILLDKSFKEIK